MPIAHSAKPKTRPHQSPRARARVVRSDADARVRGPAVRWCPRRASRRTGRRRAHRTSVTSHRIEAASGCGYSCRAERDRNPCAVRIARTQPRIADAVCGVRVGVADCGGVRPPTPDPSPVRWPAAALAGVGCVSGVYITVGYTSHTFRLSGVGSHSRMVACRPFARWVRYTVYLWLL